MKEVKFNVLLLPSFPKYIIPINFRKISIVIVLIFKVLFSPLLHLFSFSVNNKATGTAIRAISQPFIHHQSRLTK